MARIARSLRACGLEIVNECQTTNGTLASNGVTRVLVSLVSEEYAQSVSGSIGEVHVPTDRQRSYAFSPKLTLQIRPEF